uniref:CSON001514 protein n=1 Tax=Culicoides sonorensis TaxID=179676 RepID=A0A336LQZ6_CULSO
MNSSNSLLKSFNLSELNYNYLIGQALLVQEPYDPDDRIQWNNFTNANRTTNVIASPMDELNVPYALFEILVAILAVIGNAAVIIVFQQEKRLRRRTNYYIVSLALADFLVGLLGIPFAIMASVGLPRNMHACLCTVSLLMVLCTISIFCLVAVSVDRYWAILYCISYNRNVSTRTAIIIISICWIAGSIVGFLPLFGWHAEFKPDQACLFVEVMDYSYLVFLCFGTIVTPAVILAAFYAHIYTVILRQLNTNVPVITVKDDSSAKSKEPIRHLRRQRGGTMLRVLGAAQKREVKATQNLSIIVLFFMICWMPLYTINCINAFCSMCLDDIKLTNFCIILSHLNSALNPILYAYHLRDFRKALKTSMMRLCGMKLDEPEPKYKVSLVSNNRNLINNTGIGQGLRSQSQPRIFIGSNVRLQSRDSPSPRNKHSTQQKLPNNSVVNLTVDTHCKIWQIVENKPSPLSFEKKSAMHRIHSLDDVINKDKDFFINYFSTNATSIGNGNGHVKEPSSTTDEGFNSNENYDDDASAFSNDEKLSENKTQSNKNTKKLLFSTHAQFSKDFSLDDDGGVEESIMLSEIEPRLCELLTEGKDGEKGSNFQLPTVKNEVFVKIYKTGSCNNIEREGSDNNEKDG